VGLPQQPEPQRTFQDRIRRAQQFIAEHPDAAPHLYIDGWDDQFEQQFRAWPDRYYYVTSSDPIGQPTIITTSSYGQRSDALIDYDCAELIADILAAGDLGHNIL